MKINLYQFKVSINNGTAFIKKTGTSKANAKAKVIESERCLESEVSFVKIIT